MRIVVLVALAVAMARPAAADSVLDYGAHNADAIVPLGAGHFNIWIHKAQDRFLIEPSMATAFSGGGHYPDPTWRTIAEAFVAPIGCSIVEIRPLSRMGAAWQAKFTCPSGTDLHALAKAQHDALNHGAQLHN